MNKLNSETKEIEQQLIIGFKKDRDYSHSNFESLILNGLVEDNGDFSGIDLRGTKLSDCNFKGSFFSLVYLNDANLSGANLSNCNFLSCHLENVNLSNADLSNSEMGLCDFSGANLSNSNMSNSCFSNSAFVGANLEHANLSNSDFIYAVFIYANLQHANFENADLSEADFTGANLAYANLTNANLVGAKLANANFKGANLSNAKIHELDIHSVSSLGEENLRKMIIVPYLIPEHKELNYNFNSKFYCFSDDINQSKIVAPIKAETKLKIETKINRENIECRFSLSYGDLDCLTQRNKSDLQSLVLNLISETERVIQFRSLYTEDMNGERLISYGVKIQLTDDKQVRKFTLQLIDDNMQLDFY